MDEWRREKTAQKQQLVRKLGTERDQHRAAAMGTAAAAFDWGEVHLTEADTEKVRQAVLAVTGDDEKDERRVQAIPRQAKDKAMRPSGCLQAQPVLSSPKRRLPLREARSLILWQDSPDARRNPARGTGPRSDLNGTMGEP